MRTKIAGVVMVISFVSGFASRLNAGTIDNSTVSVSGFTAFDSDFVAGNAIDNAGVTDYASLGGGDSTFLDFNFGSPQTFTTITQTDRLTSGGPSTGYTGGTADFNNSYNLIFSTSSSFSPGSIVGTVPVSRPTPPVAGNKASQFTTITQIPNYTAQYVRWQVTNGSGNNGASNFVFNGAPGFDGTNATAGGTAQINIGKTFDISPTSGGITLDELGVFDYQGDGLKTSHLVTLYQLNAAGNAATSETPIESVTVGNGTSGMLANGYRYASLLTPVYLAPGTHWAVVAYGMDTIANGGDPYGDGSSGPLNPQFANVISSTGFDPYEFGPTSVGNTDYPSSGDFNAHSAASFLFEGPEPSSLALLAIAGAGLIARRRRP